MATITNIDIFDVFGRNVLTMPVETHGRASLQRQQPSTPINISFLPAGVYFVRIQIENNVITKKLIKY